MVHRDIANSRMKDFYDIWVLATTYTFEANALRNAIQSTFARRDTPLPVATPLALTAEFAEDSTKLAQWTAFIGKGKLLANEALALSEIAPILERLIMPVLTTEDAKSWDPKTLDWKNLVDTNYILTISCAICGLIFLLSQAASWKWLVIKT